MLDSVKKGFSLFVILLLCGCSSTLAPSGNNRVSGSWHGAITMPEQALYISVHLQQASGEWSGRIDIPQQRLTGFPLTNIKVEGDSITFVILGIPGEPTFDGQLASGRISGEYRQGGERNAFDLGRETLEIPGMMSAEQAALLIDNQLAAYNSHDLEKFLRFFHPDIETYNFPNQLDKRGLDALRTAFAETFKANPSEKVITRIIDRNNVIDQVDMTYQFMGHRITERSTVIYTIENGLIRRMTFL